MRRQLLQRLLATNRELLNINRCPQCSCIPENDWQSNASGVNMIGAAADSEKNIAGVDYCYFITP